MNEAGRTQRITAVDIANGRIRIPIGQKSRFPSEKTRIDIRLKGVELGRVSWDPRLGPDRERSGVLYIGSKLADLVDEDDCLGVTSVDGAIAIGPGS